MFNDEYYTMHISNQPWNIVWIYNDGRKLAHYNVSLREINKEDVKTLKVKKEWKCEVCDNPIHKGEEAIRFKIPYVNLYTHKKCVCLNIN
jgi:hypothetical protein